MNCPDNEMVSSRLLPLPIVAAFATAIAALFAWNVAQYSFVCDDAFISFRYARNLVDGLGIVWNEGERVEGYSNFSWVLLAAAGMKLGITPELLTRLVGIVSGAAILVFLIHASAREIGIRHPAVWLAPAILAASRTFTAWCTGGLETMFCALLLFLAVLQFLKERSERFTVPLGSAALLAVAALTRPDAVLFPAVLGLFFLAEVVLRKRAYAAIILWGALILVPVVIHLLWRHSYYGAWLPNSFHAKVNGLWFDQSLHYFRLFHKDYAVGWFLPLILLPVLVFRSRRSALFLAIIAVHTVYLLLIGGDHFEFRFLVVLLPFVYWLAADGLRAGLRLVGRFIPFQRIGPVAVSLVALLMLFLTVVGSRSPEALWNRGGVASIREMKEFAETRIEDGLFLKRHIESGALPSDVIICVGGAGAVPYYTGWPTVDYHGINDAAIARLAIDDRGTIAHEKHASMDYLVEKGVEMFDDRRRLVCEVQVMGHNDPRFAPGRWKSIQIDNKYINCVTFLSERAFHKRFGHLKVVR